MGTDNLLKQSKIRGIALFFTIIVIILILTIDPLYHYVSEQDVDEDPTFFLIPGGLVLAFTFVTNKISKQIRN